MAKHKQLPRPVQCLTHRRAQQICKDHGEGPCTTSNEKWAAELIKASVNGDLAPRAYENAVEHHLAGYGEGQMRHAEPAKSPYLKGF